VNKPPANVTIGLAAYKGTVSGARQTTADFGAASHRVFDIEYKDGNPPFEVEWAHAVPVLTSIVRQNAEVLEYECLRLLEALHDALRLGR